MLTHYHYLICSLLIRRTGCRFVWIGCRYSLLHTRYAGDEAMGTFRLIKIYLINNHH